MPVNIRGKEYVTVAERLIQARQDITEITTEVLTHEPLVCVKAYVYIKRGDTTHLFTGISAANPSKVIEKMSPYEVAETSAVGRALGFAGYGAVDSIASADEMVKAGATEEPPKVFIKKMNRKVETPKDETPPFESNKIDEARDEMGL